MSRHWMRRAVFALAGAAALFLAGCGSGTIESQLHPSRMIAFGGGFSDIGQSGTRYTVNDGGNDIWTQDLAASFGIAFTAASAGGTSYAVGNARVVATPDAAGKAATPTVAKQIDTFLATGSFTSTDLVFIDGGIADIIAEVAKVNAGTQTSDQALANVKQAGTDLGTQVRRLVQAGAQHVVVAGTYDLSKTPWAASTSQGTLLSTLSTQFNTQLLISIVDLGANVLYVDAALLYNLMANAPAAYAFVNSTDAVCTSVDPGNGIGIGTGKVNSALCNASTVVSGSIYNQYLWADPVYPTPSAHLKFAQYAYDKITARW